MTTTDRQHAILSRNATQFIMDIEKNPDAQSLIIGLDQPEDTRLVDNVIEYHDYAKVEAEDRVEFLWGINSIIHYALVDHNVK